jgi:hypothetical protein
MTTYELKTPRGISALDGSEPAWAAWSAHIHSDDVRAGDELFRVEPKGADNAGQRTLLAWVPRYGQVAPENRAITPEARGKRRGGRRAVQP